MAEGPFDLEPAEILGGGACSIWRLESGVAFIGTPATPATAEIGLPGPEAGGGAAFGIGDGFAASSELFAGQPGGDQVAFAIAQPLCVGSHPSGHRLHELLRLH